MKKYLTNWKTTSTGIMAIIGALTRLGFAIKNKDLNEEAIMTVTTGILAGLGLIFARDFNKSSEESGANTTPKAMRVKVEAVSSAAPPTP